METKVKQKNIGQIIVEIIVGLLPEWSLASNISYSHKGRLWLIWLPVCFQVYIISMSARLIHAHVRHGSGKEFYCTMVYGANDAKDREMLWSKLGSNTISTPWIVCGDFNNVLHTNERVGGQQVSHTEVNALKGCMDACSLFDLK